jgi:hypothetical protein
MPTVTPAQLAQLREQLASYPPALTALQEIEDCEGDIADAAMSLAIRAGQLPQEDNSAWLADLAKRCRSLICDEIPRDNLQKGAIDKVILAIANAQLIPAILATPVVLSVLAEGLDNFCEPLDQTRV